ncbi:MAG TPA: hypothetical protein VFK34_04690 [Marmoricola sp.]|jgi:hypothetical protein|nr:hypothetical protein [Marmoricola sp.]
MRTERAGRGLPEVAVPPPTDRVLAWRREQLLAAGFDEPTADDLARQRGVDLHAVLGLVAKGCPPALAARIMDTGAGPRG